MIKIFVTYFLTFFVLVLPAQQSMKTVPIQDIEFFGVEQASQRTVEKWFSLQKGDAFDPDVLHEKCLSLLNGYAAANMPYTSIDSLTYRIAPDSSGAVVRVYIQEGKKIEIGNIELSGLPEKEAESILDDFYTKPAKSFQTDRLERDLYESLTTFEKAGFPFIKYDLQSIKLDSVSQTTDHIGLAFRAAKGPKLVLKEIQIIGNEVTKDEVILREIRINEGDLYDYNKVAKIPARLMKLGYFRRVAEPTVFLAEGDQGGLLINVEEGNTSSFDGVVGYTPGTGEDTGYFTGLINISLGNLFGTGRSFLAHWQKRDKFSQDMKFHYREPWVAGLPVHLGGGFSQLIQDSTYIEREYGLDATLPLVEGFSVIGDVQRMAILPDSLGSYMLGIPRSQTLSASIGIQYDSRDDLLNPGRGIYYFTSVETGAKNNLGPQEILESYNLDDKVNNRRFVIDIDFFIPTFNRQVLALALHGRQITSSEEFIPITDQYRLGGTRSLRGYREDQFRGANVAWTNIEYRYVLGARSRAFIFCDLGYYYADNPAGVSEDFKIGYGFGIRLETGLGIMGIDYGLAYGEKQGLMSGLLHVGLVNEF